MVEYKNMMLEKNYQEIKNLYQNYMYTYHDIKNHLIVLQNYCNKGENKNGNFTERKKLFRIGGFYTGGDPLPFGSCNPAEKGK